MNKLHKKMSQSAFDNGYFYLKELTTFARSLGIAVSNLKKNELELHIKKYLFGYTGELPIAIANRKNSAARDLLQPDNPVVNYVDDKITKSFLLKQIEKQFGCLPDKSGQWYWLNSWRKARITDGDAITYADLINYLASLKKQPGRLPQIPSCKMNNFISDFIDDPDNQGKGKAEAQKAWLHLKTLELPKNYQAYKNALMYPEDIIKK